MIDEFSDFKKQFVFGQMQMHYMCVYLSTHAHKQIAVRFYLFFYLFHYHMVENAHGDYMGDQQIN